MFKHLTLAAAVFASVATGLAATPAAAQRYDRAQAYEDAYRDGYNRDDRRGYDRRGYDERGDRDRRYYSQSRRCRTGATGSILGAIAGGLLGNSIAGRGDRTLGTVLGAGGGALAGHAIEKGGRPEGCR